MDEQIPQDEGSVARILAAVRDWFMSGGQEPQGRDVAEQVNAALPDALSGRAAVLAKRRQMNQMDDALRGN